MTEQGADELHSGPEREPVLRAAPPGLRRTVVGLAGTAVVLALVLVLGDPLGSGSRPLRSGPGPVSMPTLTPAPTAAGLVDAVAGAGPLAVGAICTHTDGTRALLVQFQVANRGLGRVTVLGVRPVLPLGGLVPDGVTLPRSPSCGTPAARTRGSTVLEPGQRVGVQLAFRLPTDCPAPYPVAADIDLMAVGENPGTQRVFLLADLGGVRFDACHT